MESNPSSQQPLSPNLSVRVPSEYVQPRSSEGILPTPSNSATRVSDLKISIKSSLIPSQQSQVNNANNLVRFVRNNTFNQYLQNRHCATSQLMDSLKNSTSNTKTNSFDQQKQTKEKSENSNAEMNEDDESSNADNTNIDISKSTANTMKHEQQQQKPSMTTNKKRLFSSLPSTQTQQNEQQQQSSFEPLAKYRRLTTASNAVQAQTQAQVQKKKTPNVNIWSWKPNDVIEWLLSFEIGKLYLCQFARAEVNGLKLTLLNGTSLKQMGVSIDAHRNYLLQRIQALIKIQNDHNQHIPFRCLYCNVYSPSRVVILQHMNQSHSLSLPILLSNNNNNKQNEKNNDANSSKVSEEICKLAPTKKGKKSGKKKGDTRCPFCKKTYSSVYYLKKHTKKSHNWDLTAGAAVNSNDEDEYDNNRKRKKKGRKKKKQQQRVESEEWTDAEEESDVDMMSNRDSSNALGSSSSGDLYSENIFDQSIKKSEYKCHICNQVMNTALDMLAHVAQHQ